MDTVESGVGHLGTLHAGAVGDREAVGDIDTICQQG